MAQPPGSSTNDLQHTSNTIISIYSVRSLTIRQSVYHDGKHSYLEASLAASKRHSVPFCLGPAFVLLLCWQSTAERTSMIARSVKPNHSFVALTGYAASGACHVDLQTTKVDISLVLIADGTPCYNPPLSPLLSSYGPGG